MNKPSLYVICLAVIFALLISCSDVSKEEFCANELYMQESDFEDWPRVMTLELPLDTGIVLFSEFMAEKLPETSIRLPIRLALDKTNYLELDFTKWGNFPHCGSGRKVDVFIGRFNRISLDCGIGHNDSLTFDLISLLKKQRTRRFNLDSIAGVLEYSKKKSEPIGHEKIFVRLDWDIGADKEFIRSTLVKIQDTFSIFYEEMSMQYFNKSLCQLDSIEIHAIKSCHCVFICEPLRPPSPPPTSRVLEDEVFRLELE